MSDDTDRAVVGCLLVVLIAASVLVIGGIATGGVASRGPRQCMAAIGILDTSKTPSTYVVSTVWSRTLRDHWVSALVIRSGNLEERPSTVVCHFKSTNYVFDHPEWFSGDQTAVLKSISVANWDPRAWFK